MGLIKNLKKLKLKNLKKLQPGKLVKGAIDIAATAGVPGAAAAQKVANRVGKRVDDFNRTKERIAAQTRELAKNSGLDLGQASSSPAPGMQATEAANMGMASSTGGGIGDSTVVLVFIVLVAFMMFKK